MGYMPTLAKSAPNRFDSPGASRRMNACLTGSEHSARPITSHSARFSGGRLRMYSGNRSIFTRVGRRRILDLAAAMHRTVGGRLRHQRENLRVDVVREHAVEFEMEERLLDRARRVDRLRDEIGQTRSGAAAVVQSERRGLVHRGYSWFSWFAEAICGKFGLESKAAPARRVNAPISARNGRHRWPARRVLPRCAAAGCISPGGRSGRASRS